MHALLSIVSNVMHIMIENLKKTSTEGVRITFSNLRIKAEIYTVYVLYLMSNKQKTRKAKAFTAVVT